MSLQNGLFHRPFSHIYIEKDAYSYEATGRLLQKFQNSHIIEIDHYKDVFSRWRQNWGLQKISPKLILAVKKDRFLYEGARPCQDFGNAHFYYTSAVTGCLYDCAYCYLQGMYPSANVVVFVNIDDYFAAVDKKLKNHPLYLCVSYDTDILAMENFLGYGEKWAGYAATRDNILIELRQKSANYLAIEQMTPTENMILAWTLSPEAVIRQYEHGTPSLESRIRCIKKAISNGWKVRLCFDPLLHIEGFNKTYGEFFDRVFSEIPGDRLLDISVGTFRVGKDHLKHMRKARPHSMATQYPYQLYDGLAGYEKGLAQEMNAFAVGRIGAYADKEKIFLS